MKLIVGLVAAVTLVSFGITLMAISESRGQEISVTEAAAGFGVVWLALALVACCIGGILWALS